MDNGKGFFAGVVDTGEYTVETSAVRLIEMQFAKKQAKSFCVGPHIFEYFDELFL
jgi:hypothetical protein